MNIRPTNIILQSLKLGALAGLTLAGAYALFAIPLVGVFLVVSNIPSGKVLEAALGAWLFAVCAWPFGIILGVLPGVLLGLAGGLLTGLFVLPFRGGISKMGAALIGLGVAAAIITGAHLLLLPGLMNPSQAGLAGYLPYLFWLGGPSLFVIAGISWVGWKLI